MASLVKANILDGNIYEGLWYNRNTNQTATVRLTEQEYRSRAAYLNVTDRLPDGEWTCLRMSRYLKFDTPNGHIGENEYFVQNGLLIVIAAEHTLRVRLSGRRFSEAGGLSVDVSDVALHRFPYTVENGELAAR